MTQELLIIFPFLFLLLSIAVLPVTFPEFWSKNYSRISVSLSSIVIVYYLMVDGRGYKVLHTLDEYFSFITLLFSLYLVSGGIFIKIKGKSTPLKNVILLFIGGALANIFGTTGSSMLLIRPYLDSNKYRLQNYQIIFFIFIIGNIGGSLSPVGDPPLLIGFIKGVPFFWYFSNLVYIWLFTVGLLLTIFFLIDRYYYGKVEQVEKVNVKEEGEKIKVEGIWNMLPLVIIVASVLIQEPKYLREIIMLLSAVISYRLTPKVLHEKNHFSFEPIKEVSILFLGIFITMIPALSFVSDNSKIFGLDKLGNVYWFAGTLTSFLDNAPTFLNFLTGSMSSYSLSVDLKNNVLDFANNYTLFLKAISVASVFFGAMTYIGNAPNFMIKSIAEQKGLKMSGFFEYMYKYSLVILLPVFILIWYIFF
ncbi:MAG: sodium:proton antiporter [Ignavibacteriae bacterium]|nr:sodium:proton antiporter [Ignavibacteriota bacterium]